MADFSEGQTYFSLFTLLPQNKLLNKRDSINKIMEI